jgi:cell division protein ZapA (FtsZ GTPase activity inhibitor)
MGAMENENRITIPDFSKDDFLTSSKPFQWIIDQADGNEFVKGQLVAQMASKAKQLKVSNFKTQFTNYVRAQKGQSIVYGNVMEFSGTAIMWDTGEWIANDDGVYKTNAYGVNQFACPHPIFILTRYSNVDTDVESVQLVYGRAGRTYKTKIVPRSDLASANKIVKLAEYGVGVTSENAKALVQFLSDFESINYDKIVEKKSCDHMGWVGRGYKEFAPYISDLEFEGQDTFRQLFNSVKSVGSYDKWLETIKNYRKNGSIVVRMVMAASFASVLLKPLGALPFFVHLWGDTETGKSVALLAAVSIWAEPVIGKYAYTFNSTDVGNELYAACLNSLPLCMDELQILNKRSDFDDIIYRLCEGTGRLRGKKDGGIQNIKTWRNCIITTGERPITSMSSGGGAVNRVIEIECNGGKFFKNPREFCRTIQSSYGHAGKVFVENLTENLAEARELHEKYIKLLEDNTDATDKQIASAAALLTADELSERWIFNDGIRIGIDDIKPYLQTKDMLNVNRRAYDYLREEVISNYNNFKNNDNECWGIAKEGYIYILRNKFNAILQSGNFNPQSTLSWMARNGKLAKTDGRNLSVKVQINGTRIRCICLHEDDGEFTEMDIDDEDLPFDI